MKKGYSYKSIEAFVFNKLFPAGYEIHQIPGSLVDNCICIAQMSGIGISHSERNI